MYCFALNELNFKRPFVVVIIACTYQTKQYRDTFRNDIKNQNIEEVIFRSREISPNDLLQ